MNAVESLRGGIVVSVQAKDGSALDDPQVIAAMAAAAVDGGACAVRIQGVRNLEAVRRRVGVPIVGIIKRGYEGFEPYITPTLREVGELLACGADIVAFDATGRQRPEATSSAEIVEAIHAGGAAAMADCAQPADGNAAAASGAEILASTLCGYTPQTRGHALPALDLVGELAQLGAFVICEGGVHTPEQAGRAIAAGAHAVVVGTAISNVEWVTARFVDAVQPGKSSHP